MTGLLNGPANGPPGWLNNETRGLALLVRHAERPDIPKGSYGHDLSITPAGREAARILGRQLGPRLGRVVASSVPRCLQTAAAIVHGAGSGAGTGAGSGGPAAVSIRTDPRLGDPGAWIADELLARDAFLDGGPSNVVRRQLQGPVPGMHSLAHGTAAMLACFFQPAPAAGTIDVFISHDAVMVPLLGHLLSSDDFDTIWPRFLEGAWFIETADGLLLRWRGRTRRLGARELGAR